MSCHDKVEDLSIKNHAKDLDQEKSRNYVIRSIFSNAFARRNPMVERETSKRVSYSYAWRSAGKTIAG